MKKLFTLVALLTCFIGAKAVEITDYTADFTKLGKSTIGWTDGSIQADWLTADDDGLHMYNPEAMANWWAYQLWVVSGGIPVEAETEYTVKVVAKVSEGSATVRCKIGDWGGGLTGNIVVSSTDYEEYTFSGVAATTGGGFFAQFGDYVGTLSFKSITVTHEGIDEKPVEWKELTKGGDASTAWDAAIQTTSDEGWADICAWSKEYGVRQEGQTGGEWIHPAEITTDPDDTSNKVFASHSQIVSPVILGDDGQPGAANEWQNQFWIVLPRALGNGEPYKVSFRYKASEDATVTSQNHKKPGDYLGGANIDDSFNFTTKWTTYSSTKELTAPAAGTFQSIAFNFGPKKQYEKDIIYYFDDIKVEIMQLKEGFFAAAIDTDNGGSWQTYNFDDAVELIYDETDDAYVGTVGTPGESGAGWVNQAMVSTQYGNAKGFKANALKVTGKITNDKGNWLPYSAAAQNKINLPVRGVWKIYVAPGDGVMSFEKLEGDPDLVYIDIEPNPEVLVINAVERQPTSSEQPANDEEGIEAGTGQTWDNQFFIVANRELKPGEETVLAFDYVAEKEAATSTSYQGEPGAWIAGAFDVPAFTTTEQHFEETLTIPADKSGIKSIAFDLACIKDANVYTIKNVIWKLSNDTESLINQTGTDNFKIKIGAGNAIVDYGTDPSGISTVASKKNVGSAVIYNLAGQRVSNGFKGIVVKDGKKYVK